MKKMQTTNLNNELERLLPEVGKFEPELFRNFITYWVMRKSNSLNSINTLNEIKSSNELINLIESNHKFRSLYGEETAKKLIELIKDPKS